MTAEFCIKFKLDLPAVKGKHEMTEQVNMFVSALDLEDWVVSAELLNHTLIITDG